MSEPKHPIPPSAMTVKEFWEWVELWKEYVIQTGISVWADPPVKVQPGDSMIITYEMVNTQHMYFIQIIEENDVVFDWDTFDKERAEYE